VKGKGKNSVHAPVRQLAYTPLSTDAPVFVNGLCTHPREERRSDIEHVHKPVV